MHGVVAWETSFVKDQGMSYQSCVSPAMLYGNETWCLRENEMGVLRRTERAMVRAVFDQKLADRKNTEDMLQCRR